ncbi:PIN domain-containing protein [Paraburkholderia nemoris]|uniref:PIN domain-containing protein n=1 Tax=Paraburkholderia nemoris TaxID=2793076 RepID=UPI0038B75F9E
MATRVLVDTCVWLNLAGDQREQAVLYALEKSIREGKVELAVPDVVIREFDRNRDRVVEEAWTGLKSHFRMVRQAVSRFADDDTKASVLTGLNEVDRRIGIDRDDTAEAADRIGELLRSVPAIVTTGPIKQRVTDRALAKLAPFHRAKNSVADAILIEMYAEMVAAAGADTECAFVTQNFKDFSDAAGDFRAPHVDLADLFNSPRSNYYTSLIEVLRRVDLDALDEDYELGFGSESEPRRLSEILDAEYVLYQQVWYNRHMHRNSQIEEGAIKLVGEEEYDSTRYRDDQILHSVWEVALIAAKGTEDEIGLENLGPWDDFEWGMINGKLSALRWILGDEWDMLDT